MSRSFIYLTRFWLKSLHYFLTLSVQSGLRPDNIVEAISLHEEALQIVTNEKDLHREILCLGELGIDYFKIDKFEESLEFLEKAKSMTDEIKYRTVESKWNGYLGKVNRKLGQMEKAQIYLESAIHSARIINDPHSESKWLLELGETKIEMGEPEIGRKYIDQSKKAHKTS